MNCCGGIAWAPSLGEPSHSVITSLPQLLLELSEACGVSLSSLDKILSNRRYDVEALPYNISGRVAPWGTFAFKGNNPPIIDRVIIGQYHSSTPTKQHWRSMGDKHDRCPVQPMQINQLRARLQP